MSNELVRQAAEAVEDLRKALELWCTRDLAGPNALDVHRSGPAAVAAADTAMRALMSIREQTEAAVLRYRTAQDARVTELLTPAVPVNTSLDDWPPAEQSSYTCGDCGQVFPVDPADPIESHGAYLDHQADHDADPAPDPDPTCIHCGAELRWHDGMGVWQAPTVGGWTDQCPPSADHYHRPDTLQTPEADK